MSGGVEVVELAAARTRAAAERKLLVIVASSASSDACARMDAETWPDPQLVAWLRLHAIVARVDEAAGAELGIARWPTTLAVVDGEELDRLEGPRTAASLLAWLDDLASGGSSFMARMRRERIDRLDVPARLASAEAAVRAGDHATALAELTWLWWNMREHGDRSRRELVDVLTPLLAQDLAARGYFAPIRAELAPGTPFDVERFHDWHTLNLAYGALDTTLAWYEAQSDGEIRGAVVGRLMADLECVDRWADAGRIAIVDEPELAVELAHHQWLLEMVEAMDRKDRSERHREWNAGMRDDLRASWAKLVRALAAAGRAADVATVIATFTGADPDIAPRLAEARAIGEADAAKSR